MKSYYRVLSVLILLALVPFSAIRSKAEDESYGSVESGNYDNRNDPPTRAVRMQYMSGSVSVQPHGTDEWVAGQLNRPLTNSDNIWADKESRAEISAGTGLIRLDSESSLTLTNVDENSVQLQLHQGAMNLHVRRLYDNEVYEVDTPNQAFTVLKPGDYRFDVDPDTDKTVVTVWRGEGESSGNGPAVRIRENQQARFTNGNSLTNDIHEAPAPDSFDQWSQMRDSRMDHSRSARYVSADVVGYEDLDEYGSWRHNNDYGDVWVPSGVGAGWAPYRYGHWVWIDPWGWTWVEDEPWGYAPFHYGRWVYADDYWAWAPGPIWYRPYYAPALVAWFGGPGWGVGFGFGGGFGYGWCPLGFGEPFIPWYGVSRGYFNRVNITNTNITNVNITNIYNNTYINKHGGGGTGGAPYGMRSNLRYANMHAPNGFTAVSRNALVSSQPVARNAIRITPNQLSRATQVRALDVKPTRATMLGPNNGQRAAAPPPRSFARPVVSRMTAPSAKRGGDGAAIRNGGLRGPGSNAQSPTRGMEASNRPGNGVRMPERGSVGARSVPRPPSAGGMDNRGAMRPGDRGSQSTGPQSNVARPGMGAQNSPRPNAGRSTTGPGSDARSGVARPGMSGERPMGNRESVPRPPAAGGMSRGGERPQMNAPRGPQPGSTRGGPARDASPSRSGDRPGPRSDAGVPRPPSSMSPRESSGHGDRGGSIATNRGPEIPRPTPSYQGRPSSGADRGSYSRPAPSYEGRNHGRPSPSSDRGSYQRPAPSYGGGYSRPSAPYGGGNRGGGYSAPSYGRGGGSPSYGGGRPSGGYGGGGGGHSAGGYSGHSAGGYSGGGSHASAPSGGGGHSSSDHGHH